MTRNQFWDLFERGEIYMVRGALVVLRDYLASLDLAVVVDEDGQPTRCAPGLIRLID